jgi:eukaryotic-like serine/threonine-protein kinase
MATVFLATDLKHKRPVALKLLHPELARTLGPERFQREIDTAARLQHPHILTVHDSGETDGQLWFTMPFVEGESLRERLRREVQLPVDEALRIATDAARALEYAHHHGVVHRDIKPENLLLTTDGSTLVADFGIARALSEGDDRLTQTGMSVGTPAYMSPEQAAGDRGLDARSDIYSLGCVLYEMLAGEPPFSGPTAQAVMAKRLSGEVPHVREVRPSVPEAVEHAVTRALAPVVADRFPTAAEFARALQTTLATPTVPLAPGMGSGGSRAAPPGGRSRRRVPVAPLTLALGFLLGLGVLFAWRRSRVGGDEAGGSKVLAVLPFENLGDSADAYFSDGVSDEIRTKLAQVAGIQVIARGSSTEYRKTDKTPQQIARELGVDYLLTATVRWDKGGKGTSRVRVATELVEVSPGQAPRTKWGQHFDAALTDVFEVQANIASQVANALDVALGDSIRRELSARPTQDLDAYDAYLRGMEIRTGDIAPAVLHAAEAEFQRAVDLDSTFASAWAELATTHILLFRLGGLHARDAEAAAAEVDRAAAIAPALPDVHAARGLYQDMVRGDAASALREYEAGLRVAPNRADLLAALSGVEADLGRPAAALSHLERAARLDPRSLQVSVGLFNRYSELRRYAEAQAALDRARALRPSSLSLIYTQAVFSVTRGDSTAARRALGLAHQVADSTTVVAYVALREDLLWLLDEAQQRLVLALTPADLDGGRADWAIALAQTYWRRGDRPKALAYADTANVAFEALLGDIPSEADRAQVRVLQALALAYLGRKHEAIRRGSEALHAAEAASAPASQRAYIQSILIRIHLFGGEPDKALDQLEQLLRIPEGYISAGWLRIDPTFAPLRGKPRFERLANGT